MAHNPRIKFLIPPKKQHHSYPKKGVTIRDMMEVHEEIDRQYDTKIKEHALKMLHKHKEDTQKKIRTFVNVLFLSHLLVLAEMWLVWRIWKAFN